MMRFNTTALFIVLAMATAFFAVQVASCIVEGGL